MIKKFKSCAGRGMGGMQTKFSLCVDPTVSISVNERACTFAPLNTHVNYVNVNCISTVKMFGSFGNFVIYDAPH